MGNKKRIIVCVSNDLVTDQRVKKVCAYLHENGFEVTLLGRKLNGSLPLTDRPYKTRRFRLLFNKGPLFYACLNIRLFFYLLFHSTDWILSNDLDTLPACHKIARWKSRIQLVYDTHEIFCEVPELANAGFKKRVWLKYERKIVPRLKKVYTVNDSIASYYLNQYGNRPFVVRNISNRYSPSTIKTRTELGLPEDKFIIIIQGSGINIDRGNEEILDAFALLDDSYFLLIAGSGDVIPKLKEIVRSKNLSHKVLFKARMPYADLMQYTSVCNAGISMDKDTNLNYRYSLPNKLFDFMHAGIPIIASDLPEIKKIVLNYNVGVICPAVNAESIAKTIQEMKNKPEIYNQMRQNCITASNELNWENESKRLDPVYDINV